MTKRKSVDSTNETNRKKRKIPNESKLKEIPTLFLSDKKHSNLLIDLLDYFDKPTKTPASCIIAVEKIFVEVLKRKDLVTDDTLSEVESQYQVWLRGCYEDAWEKLRLCLKKGNPEARLQALNSLFKLLATEAQFPLNIKNKKKKRHNNFPTHRFKEILQSLCSSQNISQDVLKRFYEYAEYKDVLSNVWLSVNMLLKSICKQQPKDETIWNICFLLSGLPKGKKKSDIVLCSAKNVVPEDKVVSSAVDEVWKQLASWQYSNKTHQLIMVVLVEHMLPLMENDIFLTDYFMDALNRDDCEINMVALQGIFNLVLKHNIEYPDIFGKLYQLFSVEALEAKYKTRLFALADEFLRSTHLPLALVAAFAKRFSRLLLVASPPDCLILLTFIANLLIRHPDLKFLCHNPNGKPVAEDLYLEDERDPLKSRASQSQLWEVKLLQHHYVDRVAKMAGFIDNDLPSVEYQLEPLLDITWLKMIKKDIKVLSKNIPKVAEKFQEKPLSIKAQEVRQKELKLLYSDITSLFVF